ncbi:glycosyl hydrolase family 28-related protein [Noviluteimonas gilva]|uniref:Pectate lyase superfamily protein domain-containing protein n=1 Tax=Noviluteimonas gilva TaxID=2682097 RepID=A0A7C9HZY0_9GAMM|nr:right-handed parallel beta-helix repeat-containing protein [Lysobacter gilvus]MUV15134.1 hypothetical protein [Lysobacter gilvus]
MDGVGNSKKVARRAFLRNALLAAAPVVLGSTPFAAAAMSNAVYRPVSRMRGTTALDVRDFGARGDGVRDDTASINAAIQALPAEGGTVFVPAGRYLVDAVKSINLRSNMHFQLDPNAVLVCKPNAAEKSYVIYAYKVADVEISGGRVVGDRYAHLGSTGEWGHAVFVRGSQRVTVRDMRLSDCWGDGMSIGAALVYGAAPIPSEDIVVSNIVSTNNRRQGLSIGRGTNITVRDSEFSYSNGTAPECGIDIEPDDPGISDHVSIENCVLRGNRKYGLLAYKRSQNTTIRRCTVISNGSCGIVTVGSTAIAITQCSVRMNSATGIFLQDGTSGCDISQNTFYGNYARNGIVDRKDFSMAGYSQKVERDILVRGITSNINVGTNYFK